MIRLIFFPAARLIDPVSSENAPRFPLSEIKHTLFIWGWRRGAFPTVSGNEMWHLTVQSHHVCWITNFNTINHPSYKKRETKGNSGESQYFKNLGRMYCVWETSFIYATFPSKCVWSHCVSQVLQHSIHPTSYDVRGTQSQEEHRKDVISVHASLPVSPSLSHVSLGSEQPGQSTSCNNMTGFDLYSDPTWDLVYPCWFFAWINKNSEHAFDQTLKRVCECVCVFVCVHIWGLWFKFANVRTYLFLM